MDYYIDLIISFGEESQSANPLCHVLRGRILLLGITG